MAFPIVGSIEQVDSVQVGTANLPLIWLDPGRQGGARAETVACWVCCRMRESPWNEGVGRERFIRHKPILSSVFGFPPLDHPWLLSRMDLAKRLICWRISSAGKCTFWPWPGKTHSQR